MHLESSENNQKANPYRVGIAGWVYPLWRKSFYPATLVQKRELEYASRKLRTIEINGTFYALPSLASYERWYEETPSDFIFSVKGPKFITHIKKLKDVKGPLANFFASGLLALKDKLGPILWQLSPNLAYDRKTLEDFFKLLPRTASAAAKLGKHTDAHFKSEPYLKVAQKFPLRHALEVRHPSFIEAKSEFLKLLQEYNISVVYTDPVEAWPIFKKPTADFFYARLHGGSANLPQGYLEAQLKACAKLARTWAKSKLPPTPKDRDVFIYIVNEAKLHAPQNAMALQKLLNNRN